MFSSFSIDSDEALELESFNKDKFFSSSSTGNLEQYVRRNFTETSQQKWGAVLSDYAGLWALGLDMLPQVNGTLQMTMVQTSRGSGSLICNRNTGNWVPNKCKINAKVN